MLVLTITNKNNGNVKISRQWTPLSSSSCTSLLNSHFLWNIFIQYKLLKSEFPLQHSNKILVGILDQAWQSNLNRCCVHFRRGEFHRKYRWSKVSKTGFRISYFYHSWSIFMKLQEAQQHRCVCFISETMYVLAQIIENAGIHAAPFTTGTDIDPLVIVY